VNFISLFITNHLAEDSNLFSLVPVQGCHRNKNKANANRAWSKLCL